MTEILSPTPENIARVGAMLRSGALVAIPTETVYGLAANARSVDAVARVFEMKGRPSFDPLIVHVPDVLLGGSVLRGLESLGIVDRVSLGSDLTARVEGLLQAFWPGPLTVVLPRSPRVPELVTSGLSTVAVRMPAHPVAQAVLKASGCALAAPSANRFGRISPTSAAHVAQEFGGRLSVVLDGGPCEVGIESTIVSVGHGGAVLLRRGVIAGEALEAALGMPLGEAGQVRGAAPAPGMLESHYAPGKGLTMLPASCGALSDDALRGLVEGCGVGLLRPQGAEGGIGARLRALGATSCVVEVLSEGGDWREAARRVFAALRALDGSDADRLFCEPVEGTASLALAIADRLRRASA